MRPAVWISMMGLNEEVTTCSGMATAIRDSASTAKVFMSLLELEAGKAKSAR
ncbi:hypothetical protein D3C78_1556820 [compost metagenome]